MENISPDVYKRQKYVSDSRLLIPAELPEDKQNEVRKEANLPRVTNQVSPVSCSISIALVPRDGKDYQTLARRAYRLV